MRSILPLALVVASAASLCAADISPRVGAIQIFGVEKVSLGKIRAVLNVAEGGPLPGSKADIEDRLDAIPGVAASRLDAACCVDGKMVLYVGIEEAGARHIEFHPAPEGDVTLPTELSDAYDDFLAAVDQCIRLGETGENYSNGYSLMDNSGARGIQLSFLPLAAKYFEQLHQVVRESADPEQRAMAAYVLQYAPRGPRTSTQVVNDLEYSLQDIDDTVRNNACHALEAVYAGSKLHPEQGVNVQPTWFIELLNSIVWSDRHNASAALANMTEDRDPNTLALIRERALASVVEMARWRDLSVALPPFLLAGRLAGLSEKQIQDDWTGGHREEVLALALKSARKK